MAAPVFSSFPDRITAGTTVKYTKSLTDFPPTQGWAVALHLAGPTILGAFTGVANGSSWDFTLPNTETKKLRAGRYEWQEIATKAGEPYIADSGITRVDADITQAAAGDFQTPEERWLAAVEARLDGRLESDMESYGVVGRQVQKIPVEQLFNYRASLKRAVEAQKNPGKFDQSVLAQFIRPGAES